MRVAFVGIKRPFLPIPEEIGISIATFVKYHLEIPWYYSFDGDHHCYVSTVDAGEADPAVDPADGTDYEYEMARYDSDWACYDRGVYLVREDWLKGQREHYSWRAMDVVVHWRSWQQWAYDACPDSLHLMQTCDHSYSPEWIAAVKGALASGQLGRIICFDTWHVRNTMRELDVGWDAVLTNLHLGVDTRTYRPLEKDPFQLLWASDPGRGLAGCLEVFNHLYRRDRRYHLHITYPDYVKQKVSVSHPAVHVHHNMRNGQELWDLFATSAFVPYTCVFPEPSSRVHRQAQAAGCCLLYPPDMGSPSELIISGRTGVIPRDLEGKPVDAIGWANGIDMLRRDEEYRRIGREARLFALTEDWSVQAERFNLVCQEMLRSR